MQNIERESEPSSSNNIPPFSLECLDPTEEIQIGQVYNLPAEAMVEVQAVNYPEVYRIKRQDYEKRYQKIAKSLNLPPQQKHLEAEFVNFRIYDQLYAESKSAASKFMKFFKR